MSKSIDTDSVMRFLKNYGNLMNINFAMQSGTVISESIDCHQCDSGTIRALFEIEHLTGSGPDTTLVATFDNVAEFCKRNIAKGSNILIRAGNHGLYEGRKDIIANELWLIDSQGKKVIDSVKRNSRKAWHNADSPAEATTSQNPPAGSPNELLKEALYG